MGQYIKIANLRGGALRNARVLDDGKLLVDEVTHLPNGDVVVTKVAGNVKGAKGDTGTFAAAAAHAVEPGQPVRAVMSGPDAEKRIDFYIPRGEQGLPGANAVPTAEAIAQNVTLPGPARDALMAGFTTKRTGDASRQQSALYGKYLRKLALMEPVKMAIYGGSHVYGYDLNSADKVAADPTATPSGHSHTFTRSPKPFPSVLQDRLNDAHRSVHTVVNRGFAGDHVDLGFTHWSAASGADISLFMYGVNDANYVGDVQAFIDGYEKMIIRELFDYNAACVLVAPLKLQQSAGGRAAIEAYRQALFALGQRLSVPVIDGELLTTGYDARIHSDSIHLNTLGNNIVGSRLAACFIGDGVHSPNRVMHGSKLATRPYIDGLTIGLNSANEFVVPGATPDTDPRAGTPSEGSDGTAGIRLRIGGSNTLGRSTYSIYTETPDLVVIPQVTIEPNTAARIQLDYAIEQGDNTMDWLLGEVNSLSARAASEIQQTSGGTTYNWFGHATGAKALRIANPGWHTIRVSGGASASAGATRLYGLEFVDFNTLRMMQQLGI